MQVAKSKTTFAPGDSILFLQIADKCCDFVLSTDTEEPVQLNLPNQWLWDIIDEFIYQVHD